MCRFEKWDELDQYNQKYTFVDFLDGSYNQGRDGLFITIEKNTEPKEKITILFPDRLIVSCRIIYEPLATSYKKMLCSKNKNLKNDKIALLSHSLFLDIFRKENVISNGKKEERVVYLPLSDVVIEILGLEKPFLLVCLGDKIEYEYTIKT